MNDVENWEVADYTGSQWSGVFEGAGTNNYMVMGRNVRETVFDEGTNNRLIDLL